MSSDTGSGSDSVSRSDNPFIRFKRQVDEQISNGIRAVWAQSSSRTPAAATDTARQAHPLTALEAGVADGLRHQTVYYWLTQSPYSPWKLQDIRQPVPRDVPAETYHLYSFRDAFEDLLVVSAGQPLPALPWRRPGDVLYRLGNSWNLVDSTRLSPSLGPPDLAGFADGVSPTLWAAQLERRGLWKSFFPAETFAAEASRIVRQVTSESIRAELGGPAEAERHVQFLIRESSMGEEQKADRWASIGRPSLLSHLARLAPELFWGVVNPPPRRELWERPASKPASIEEPSQEADTSEDLFLNLRSDFATSNGRRPSPAGDALVPVAHEKETINQSPREPEGYETTETIESPDGSKTVKTVERRVSPHSNKETTTTIQYDAQGNVVHRSTVKHYSGGWSFGGQSKGGQHNEEDDTHFANPGKDKNQSGWFWTR